MDQHFLKPSGTQLGKRIWAVREGYDLAASTYDDWYWQAFWRANEMPLILSELSAGVGKTALDVGTGTGEYAYVLQSRSYRTSGLDASRGMLTVAQKKLGGSSLLVQGAAEAIPFRTATFDLVIACRVLSHINRLDDAFAELSRVTKIGGRLLISDVSSHHAYTATRIPTAAGDVHIETFKHDVTEVRESGERMGGWRVQALREVRYKDLIAPPVKNTYPAIDLTSRSPIFYYGSMTRTA